MRNRLKWLRLFFIPAILTVSQNCSIAAEPKPTARLRLGPVDDAEVAKCIQASGHPNDFALTRYIDETPLPGLRPEEERRGFLVFQRHWMDLVFPNSVPRRAEMTNKLATFASPGEYEPLTFSVRTVRQLRGLEVKAGALVSKNGDRLAAPRVQLVRCAPRAWQTEEWLYQDGPVGVMNMPTYLEQPRLLDVTARRTVQYWLTVKVDEKATPGIYGGEIQVRHEQGAAARIKMQVEVLPINLQEPPHRLGFWEFQRAYRGEIGPLVQVYQQMRDHGMNAVFARIGLFEYDKKTDTYDFSKYISVDNSGQVSLTLDGSSLEKCMEAAKQVGLKQVIYSPTLSLFITKQVLARHDKKNLKAQSAAEIARVTQRFEGSPQYDIIKEEIAKAGEMYFPLYSRAYAELYVAVVRELVKEVKKREWPTLVISSLDEAIGHHLRSRTAFPFVLRHLELKKRAGAMTIANHCAPTMGGEYGEYIRAGMKYLDIVMPGGRLSADAGRTSPYNATLNQIVAASSKTGVTTYNYSLSGHAGVRPDLSVVRFSGGFFFQTLGAGVLGSMDYMYFRPEGDPYNPVDDFNTADNDRLWSHERLWYFPPRKQADRLGGRSLALAAKREGFDDLRYLHTLNSLIEQAQAKTNSPAAQQAARNAVATRKRILKSFKFTDKTLDSNRRNAWSRFETVSLGTKKESTVGGKFRLANGWEFARYDRNRRVIAGEIQELSKVLIRYAND